MKAQYETAARYLHDGCVLVPTDVAAWLITRTDFARLRLGTRGADPRRDAVLMALTLAGHQHRASASGSREAAEPEVDPDSEWLSTGEASDLLGLSDRAVRAACEAGRMPAQQVAGRYRISRAALDQYRMNRINVRSTPMAYGSDQVQRVRDRYKERFDAVRRDASRTPEWHRLRLAELWLEMQAEVKQAREQATAAGEAHERSLHRKAFGVEGISGDSGALAISQRDAMDRVAQLENRDELVRLLERATHTGDEVLARAVAGRAFDRGDRDLLDTYASIRPDAQAPLDKLREVRTDGYHVNLRESMAAAAAKPAELQGLDEFACQRLLDDAERQVAAGEQASAFANTMGAAFRGQTPHG